MSCKESTRASPWLQVLNEREWSYMGMWQKDGHDAIDISQDLGVVRTATRNALNTLLPHNQWWLGWLDQPRCLLGEEALALQGPPRDFVCFS